jgi:uncharacterized protein involved in exopolysaccharide biosynthesis
VILAPDDGIPSQPSLATWAAGTVRRWRLIAGTIGVAIVIAVVAMIALPPAWRAQASFTPNTSPSSGAGRLAGGLGAIAGSALTGMVGSVGSLGADPSESPAFYEQLLVSRELLTRLLTSRVPNFSTEAPQDSILLVDLLDPETEDRNKALELAIRDFRKQLTVAVDNRANLVGLTVDAKWPELSALIVNRMLALVNEFNLQQRQTRGRVRRVFLASRVDTTKRELDRVTRQLRDFELENREWESSPALRFRQNELRRQADVAEDLYLSTKRDFEGARLSEINDAALITVVDSAVPPRRRQFPRVPITLGASMAAGLMLGVLLAAIAAAWSDWTRADPEGSAAVRSALTQFRREMRRVVVGIASRRDG